MDECEGMSMIVNGPMNYSFRLISILSPCVILSLHSKSLGAGSHELNGL